MITYTNKKITIDNGQEIIMKAIVTFDGMTKEDAEDLLEENGFEKAHYTYYWDKDNHLVFDADYMTEFVISLGDSWEVAHWDLVEEEN